MLRAVGPFAPPPPPGAQPPPLWGREDHLRELFGDRVEFRLLERQLLVVTAFVDARGHADHFRTQYGPTIAARANAGTVEIAASRDGNQLRLEVSDDGVGLPPSWRPETSEGVGIQNVRARLATMYGDQHTFDVKPRDGGGTIATIEIPLSMEGFDE